MNHARFFVILIFVALWPAVGLCQSTSQYLSLPNDVVITQQTTVLQATLNLTQSTKVVVVSDGRYFQNVPNSVGYMRIDVDGAQSGNDSIIDWRGSVAPAQHSYNVIGYKTLGAGPHSIASSRDS